MYGSNTVFTNQILVLGKKTFHALILRTWSERLDHLVKGTNLFQFEKTFLFQCFLPCFVTIVKIHTFCRSDNKIFLHKSLNIKLFFPF